MSQLSFRLLPCLALLTAALFWGGSSDARAQSSSDGSIYSRFGVGELHVFASPQIQAMGGGGTAMRSLNYINFSNPATWSQQVLTRAVAGVTYQGIQITDADENESLLTSGSLTAVHFGIPITGNKVGLGFGFQPYSRVSYRVLDENALIVTENAATDTAAYQISYEGDGGLQEIVGGVGYEIGEQLSIGASANLIFGIIEEARRTNFVQTQYADAVVANATRLVGITGQLGALLMLPTSQQDRGVTLGAALTLPATLYGDRTRTLGEDLDRDTLATETDGSVRLPLGVRVGASYRPNAHWTFAGDFSFEPWSGFESDFVLPGFTPGGDSQFRDRIRASAGFEILPAGTDVVAPFFSRTAYRLGVYYDQGYVVPVDGADLRTIAVTGGLSLPTLVSGTRLDLNFELGTRGEATPGLVRDRYYRVSANLNIGERWFRKRKLG